MFEHHKGGVVSMQGWGMLMLSVHTSIIVLSHMTISDPIETVVYLISGENFR